VEVYIVNSRKKGYRTERQLVLFLQEKGYNAYRIPLSGATAHYKGDIVVEFPTTQVVLEVKNRKVYTPLYKLSLPVMFQDGIVVIPLEMLFSKFPRKFTKIEKDTPLTVMRALIQAERENALLVIKTDRKPFLVVGEKAQVRKFSSLLKKGGVKHAG
jgi:hypothetical protein